MSLILGDTRIPGYDQKVTAKLPMAAADMSGNSSSTPQAETGDKPKQIMVVTHVRFDDINDLRAIVNLAEAKNDIDERQLYNIINKTAKGLNIRQVKFQGDLTVKEQGTSRAWTVSFNLIEYLSIPEKKEARVEVKPVAEQTAEGKSITEEAITSSQTDQEVELSGFEQLLTYLDDSLANDPSEDKDTA